MKQEKKLWEMPEAEPGQNRGQRRLAAKADRATEPVDTNPDSPRVDAIEEAVGALCDPLIVFPSGWEETLPEHLKKRLPLDRLAHNMMCLNGKARWDEACNLEALLYLYPACLAHPFSEQWTRIYLYLGTVCLGPNVPDDIRLETLSDYDMEQLRDLKRWIQKRKVQARKERKRGEKAEAVVKAKVEQPRLF